MSTTVIVQQPAGGMVQMTTDPFKPRGVPRDWNSGIFECFNDIPSCLLGLFCTPCHQCCVAADMDESCCVPICVPAGLIPMRALHRGRHNVQGSLMTDCFCGTFCGPCVQCQLHREIKNIKSGILRP